MGVLQYTTAKAQELACMLRADPRVFAYYSTDEFEYPFKQWDNENSRAPISNASIRTITNLFRANDGFHPVYIIAVYPNSSFNAEYDHDMYDIFGADPYVFGPNWDYGHDHTNNPAILAVKAQGAFKAINSAAYTADRSNKTPPLLPWAPMLALQAQDVSVNASEISYDDMMYQTITPLVFGSRGLLYWWNATSNTLSTWTSTALEQNINSTITFLTTTNNTKGVSLADALMLGTDKTQALKLSNISIDGNSSVSIYGTPVNFTNEAALHANYTYHKFNTRQPDGKIYTLNKTSSVPNWQPTTLNYGSFGDIRSHITALHAWSNRLFTCVQAQGTIETLVSGTTTWDINSPSGVIDGEDVCFATRPSDGVLFMARGRVLYRLNSGTLTWETVAPIQIPASPEPIVPHITSMLWTNSNTVLVSSIGEPDKRGVYQSTDAGLTWTQLPNTAPSVLRRAANEGYPEEIWSLAYDGTGTVLAGCDGRILRGTVDNSTNQISWSSLSSTNLPNTAIWTIEYVAGRWFVGTGNGIYYTTGLSPVNWIRTDGIPTGINVWDLAVDATHLYAATDDGVYRLSRFLPSLATKHMGTSSSCALYSAYTTPTIDMACRAIAVNGNHIYVGTRRYGNSYANTTSEPDLTNSRPFIDDQPLFGYTVKKYKGSYYIFAVNAFAPQLQMNVNLRDVLEPRETAYRISELNYQWGTTATRVIETQVNLNDAKMGETASFTASFGGYDAKVYRIDVLKWSDIETVTRECIAPETIPYICHTHAGGITVGNFDGGATKNDLLVMWVPETPSGDEPFRYKILWNLNVDNNYTVTHDNLSATSIANFGPNCYGSFPGVAWDVHGGDVKAFHIDSIDITSRPEIFFMGMDPNYTSTYRVKVGWDLRGSNTTPVSLTDANWNNFPAAGRGEFTMSAPTAATGGGITMFKSQVSGQNTIYPDALLMHLTDDPAANRFNVVGAHDWHTVPGGIYDPFATLATTSATAHITPYSIGWLTRGAGMDLGNLYPGFVTGESDKLRELVCGGIEYEYGDNFRFIVYNFNPELPVVEGAWRPSTSIPIKPASYTGLVKDAGLALGDIDGDGDDDLIIMAIGQECHGETPSRIYIRYGINTLKNDPAKYGKIAAGQETVSESLPTGDIIRPVTTSISNQPNPFDAATVVTYSLDQPGHVELVVYSLLGEVVLLHDAGTQQPGSYMLPFSAEKLSNGMYICRLKVNGAVVNSTKMVVAK